MYAYYEGTGETLEKLIRDAPRVPAIARPDGARGSTVLDQLAELLMAGRGLRGARRKRVRAAIGHGLQLETWRSLVRDQGLSDGEAVELVAALAAPRRSRPAAGRRRPRSSRPGSGGGDEQPDRGPDRSATSSQW